MTVLPDERNDSDHSMSWRPGDVIHCLASHGLEPATPADLPAGRALAAELINSEVATSETFAATHAKTGASVFVFRQGIQITGTLGLVPVGPDGLRMICNHSFNPRDPALSLICSPGDPFAALYGWGFAASTRKAAATVVLASMQLRDTVFAGIPCFTRAATPAGARIILTKMGYRPFPGSLTGLLISPPRKIEKGVAA